MTIAKIIAHNELDNWTGLENDICVVRNMATLLNGLTQDAIVHCSKTRQEKLGRVQIELSKEELEALTFAVEGTAEAARNLSSRYYGLFKCTNSR
jgi:hypothetical protein